MSKKYVHEEKVLDRFDRSAIVGFWRCGADNGTIAGIINCDVSQVFNVIDTHKHIEGE